MAAQAGVMQTHITVYEEYRSHNAVMQKTYLLAAAEYPDPPNFLSQPKISRKKFGRRIYKIRPAA